MLVHLSQDRGRASVVSIPRDTYAEPPARHQDAARGKRTRRAPGEDQRGVRGGRPKLTVRTVEQLTGVQIDHYLEVDFVSFMKTVDVLGGVAVCTARRSRTPTPG